MNIVLFVLINKGTGGVNNNFFKEAIGSLKINLAGLNSFSRLVMYELFDGCDYVTGTINLDSLSEIAEKYFFVNTLSGRKKEVITADTLRNAFRTIKKAKPDHFIFKTINQRIVIEMPFIRELYQSFYGQPSEVAADLAADVATAQTHIQTSEKACFEPLLAEDVAGDLAAASLNLAINACAKENIKKNNNNNKHDLSKLPISDSFFPSEEILQRARTLGLDNADDFDEIQAFIDHNKASGSLWADFNPIYLRWLIQSQERRKRAVLTATERRIQHGTSTNRHIDKRTPKERVIAAYSDTLKYCEHTHRFNTKTETTASVVPIRYLDSHTLDATN